METCIRKVSKSNYNSSLNTPSISSKLDGGLSLHRKTLYKKTTKVDVQWEATPCDYNYLVAFYFLNLTSAFKLDLIDEASGTKIAKTCRFVYGTLGISALSTSRFIIKATVEILA